MGTTAWVLAFLVGTLLLLAAIAVVARRILGVRVGLLRTLLAGTVGVTGESLFGSAVHVDGNRPALIALQLGVGVLIAMGFLAIAEAVVPSGSLGGPIGWVRAVHDRVARARRYKQIMSIAVRHGLGPYLRGRGKPDSAARLARGLRLAFEEGGVTFVKLGQVIATRHDLLPPAFITELSRLHNDVSAVSWEEIRPVLAGELGRDVGDVFADIDEEPIAAAAIAQVHRARLLTGEEVVAKIQRPGICAVVERDLNIMYRIVRMLTNRTQWGRRMGLLELADGFAEALRDELDFRVEARNTAAIKAASSVRGDSTVLLPTLHDGLTSRRVLIIGWLDGVPLGGAGPMLERPGVDRAGLARTLLDCVLRQIMVDGVFHADPHPGNVLALADGGLALIDFGSVARLDAGLRGYLQQLMIAVNAGDPAGLRDAMLELVQNPDAVDERKLERALGRFMAKNLGQGSEPDLAMFSELMVLATGFGLSVPAEIAAVFRSLLTLDGTLTLLATDFNLIDEARDSATSAFTDQVAGTALRKVATDEALSLLPMLRQFPRRIGRITGALERGEFAMQVRVLADERERRAVTGMLNSVLTAFLSGITGIMAVLLLGTAGGPSVTSAVSLYQVIGYYLLLVSGALMLRVFFLMARRS